MSSDAQLIVAALAGLIVPTATVAGVLFVRRRRGARARLYFSMRTSARDDSGGKPSNEPPPFPDDSEK
jgi:hypothetical protein